ncbi:MULTISPECIES: ABC transporter ATP-binding protein [unclassified Colwellia]|jgi:ABC-2 type transport system ATP-binding protein|uniref:ABC transporter ATP-binding protein n=1 Tax=unclassified Colwellia TaxID=196834 RepID=UPI0015F66984|nr:MULTISPECIES: ABC transporter ATP-binding protein [unclassified Colwellia]MBA6336690.1 ABC transporter ATP-binding protein [Colwellia sp. BRX8-7]MBA6348505.1 ABC transporter ATP-binding protein [Colwellia sp. BRX8-9]MBA6352352.1 ABC transporter ATP-binding protein [Colwellia sp. BRX9-1]MBA6356020.1 ABC transporter ATP-binding protein [Colwellia sp. BRX8-3]MBA6359682.1 ABC transporter ATP-binding protein [Colwellia sp. BRX8-6]|tara:strand:- start:1856 stop:2791 length:936 start_codon:yes stop_codon:yes gene_type:complete
MDNALEISGLKKVYKGGFTALKGIDLTVKQGDFFALLGPNGAGKSTTIGIITSLVNKTAGSVKVFGHDIDKELEQAKSYLGLVPQEFNFNQFETLLTILVNQAGYYGVERSLAFKRAEKYLKKLDLWDKRNDAGRMLSGGMKRRLMIARALMHEPQVLILDEPTAGVDIELRRSMWIFLRELNKQGITIILTTHYLEEAEMLCRNIAIIDSGVIVEDTDMKSLLSKLDQETIVFDIDSVTNAPELDAFTCRLIDDHTLEVDVKKSQLINDIFSQLNGQNINVRSMRNKSNRLEELFVSLVGSGQKVKQENK